MTQQKRILHWLQAGHRLTRLNAWNDLGVLEAPARISELRSKGHLIKTKMVAVESRYGETVKIAEWSL
tara:strand:+ start:1108 stop:1311 length:204 start_codon:yes stop_codon:yes gene_type:complete